MTWLPLAVLSSCSPEAADSPTAPSFAAALLTEVVVSVEDHGAIPDDGLDDADAFHAALDALELLPEPRVLLVPPGTWELENKDNRKRGLLIDVRVTLRCEAGAILRGDETPGDHLVPPEDWSSKDAIAIEVPAALTELSGVTIEGCAVAFPRAHASNEQAHAIAAIGLSPGQWVRELALRDLQIGPVGSGDGIYCGTRCEGLTVERVRVEDPARSGVVVAGNGGVVDTRRGYAVTDLTVAWTGHNPEQEGGAAIDFEPNQPTARLTAVEVRKLRATQGQLHVAHLDGGTFQDVDIGWIVTSKVDGASFTDIRMHPCQPGDGVGGLGYCIASLRPPMVYTVEGSFDVNAEGEGLAMGLDFRASPDFDGGEQVYQMRVRGRARLNGGVEVRQDTLKDPMLMDVAVELVP